MAVTGQAESFAAGYCSFFAEQADEKTRWEDE